MWDNILSQFMFLFSYSIRSNAADEKFDLTIGALEDIVMGMHISFYEYIIVV